MMWCSLSSLHSVLSGYSSFRAATNNCSHWDESASYHCWCCLMMYWKPNSSKTQRYSVYYQTWQRKAEKLHMWEAGSSERCFKKWLKRLKNSCQLIFCGPTTWLSDYCLYLFSFSCFKSLLIKLSAKYFSCTLQSRIVLRKERRGNKR